MVATANPNLIELYTDFVAFDERVGLILNYYSLEFLGLAGQGFSGCFGPNSSADLLEFCRANPEFHVVTCVAPGRYVNKYQDGGHLYFLGQGDRNPTLVLNHLISPEWQLINEDTISSALAELDKIKSLRKA